MPRASRRSSTRSCESAEFDPDDFRRGAENKERGLIAEFLGFLRETRTWWLAPILIVFLLLGVLLVIGATGVAPFLYPLVG